jgi:ATP-dependent DNA helicase RecG
VQLEGLQRTEVWTYPHHTLREALLNALMHRDYASLGDIQGRLYPDRFALWNPGELFGGLKVEDLRREAHPARLRNPLIAQTLCLVRIALPW